MATKRTPGQGVHRTAHARKRRTVGGSIVQGLKDAKARVTLVQVPEIDVRRVRLKMRLSQKEFAGKFGFPPATLRNWEQGRSRPDTPTRVLLAVLAKHPEAVEDVLRKAG
jgi:putative transcriptional regulator